MHRFCNFEDINDKDIELLYLISKEGLTKDAREEYYDRIQSVNKYVIGSLITKLSYEKLEAVKKAINFALGFN